MKHLRRRIDRMHHTLVPPRREGEYTLSELLRTIWDDDRRSYLQLVQEGFSAARILMPQFEREDRREACR